MSFEKDKMLEAQLRELKPLPPSPLLSGRIEASLRGMQRRRQVNRIRTWVAWGGLAAAATLLISFGVLLFNGRLSYQPAGLSDPIATEMVQDTPVLTDADAFQPVIAENNLKGRIDEGIVFLRNGLTARRYRYEFIDRVVWENPANGAQIEMEIPRDEVVLVPVQTF